MYSMPPIYQQPEYYKGPPPTGPVSPEAKQVKKGVLMIKLFAFIGVVLAIFNIATQYGVAITSVVNAVDSAGFHYEGVIGILLLISIVIPMVWFLCISLYCLFGAKGLICWPCAGRNIELRPEASYGQVFTSCCCVFNKAVPLVVKNACCIPYRLFGYAALPLLCGKFMGPMRDESELKYVEKIKEAKWTANPGYPMCPVLVVNVILLIIALTENVDWNKILALVIAVVLLVLTMFNCYKTCKYDNAHVDEERARADVYGYWYGMGGQQICQPRGLVKFPTQV